MTDNKELAKLFPKRERKPLTNYDRLVSKTPEELAVWLSDRAPGINSECWLDWLKQEATDAK